MHLVPLAEIEVFDPVMVQDNMVKTKMVHGEELALGSVALFRLNCPFEVFKNLRVRVITEQEDRGGRESNYGDLFRDVVMANLFSAIVRFMGYLNLRLAKKVVITNSIRDVIQVELLHDV